MGLQVKREFINSSAVYIYKIAIQKSSLAVGVSSIKIRLLHTKEAQWLLF